MTDEEHAREILRFGVTTTMREFVELGIAKGRKLERERLADRARSSGEAAFLAGLGNSIADWITRQ